MVTARRYQADDAAQWDAFVQASRNGTFLLKRPFMDYHSDRFDDHSMIFEDKGNIVAVLPANERADKRLIESHGGLTYGGLITSPTITQDVAFSLFDVMQKTYREAGFQRLLYKTIPQMYARGPTNEDLYVLHRLGAPIVRRDVTTVIDLAQPGPMQQRRKRAIKKAGNLGETHFARSNQWAEFWDILHEQLLTRYNTTPVHSVEEIKLLAGRFPDEIQLHVAVHAGRIEAGLVLFDCGPVLHVQYSASSSLARDHGLLDALIDRITTQAKETHRFFDFGISTEDQGRVLNESLIRYKQGFGGRSIIHDFYELDLTATAQ